MLNLLKCKMAIFLLEVKKTAQGNRRGKLERRDFNQEQF